MQGIVSLLDPQHCAQVEKLWAEMAHEFGVRGIAVTPYPHFSYHVATHYDLDALDAQLTDFGRRHPPFEVATTGLGIFSGIDPVLYIPVVRSPALSAFHAKLCPLLDTVATGAESYYQPDSWMPHISIGFGDVTSQTLGGMVAYLSGRNFDWRIRVDNVAVITQDGAQGLWRRYNLGT